jgi:HJR/Mrr/RecB family endonuclease
LRPITVQTPLPDHFDTNKEDTVAVLDNLSGFEFEDVVEDVFRNLGYENVRQADRRTDEGRDVLMEEDLDRKTICIQSS